MERDSNLLVLVAARVAKGHRYVLAFKNFFRGDLHGVPFCFVEISPLYSVSVKNEDGGRAVGAIDETHCPHVARGKHAGEHFANYHSDLVVSTKRAEIRNSFERFVNGRKTSDSFVRLSSGRQLLHVRCARESAVSADFRLAEGCAANGHGPFFNFEKTINRKSTGEGALLREETEKIVEYAAVENYGDRTGSGEKESDLWLCVKKKTGVGKEREAD